ncbi:MAG TPA: nuclear transport factor 2 family protein [Anaeromyxobacteraceae bacterium]|nr:nuclear transport factor 2 family protein [Anaeromyxobacteraceae bacterium]
MVRALAAAAAAALLAGAGGDGALSALLAADAAFDRALAARDPATFETHVADGAVFAGKELLVGREAVAARWARYLDPQGPVLRWKPTDAGVAGSGDLGWTIGDARFTWKQKEVDEPGLRYLTVWRKGPGGRWQAVLDGPLQPAPPGPSARTPVRTVASADGSLEASIGTYERRAGDRTTRGIFLAVRERQGGVLHTVLDSEVPSG